MARPDPGAGHPALQHIDLHLQPAREAGILVLDEPTAPMDAAAEAALFEHFRRLTADKITVLISHRLSMRADLAGAGACGLLREDCTIKL